MDAIIQNLLKDPQDGYVSALTTSLNEAVNKAHNGGWWLNKFVGQGEFDRAAKRDLVQICQAGVTAYKVTKMLPNLVGVDKFLETWAEAPSIVVGHGKVLCDLSQSETPVVTEVKKNSSGAASPDSSLSWEEQQKAKWKAEVEKLLTTKPSSTSLGSASNQAIPPKPGFSPEGKDQLYTVKGWPSPPKGKASLQPGKLKPTVSIKEQYEKGLASPKVSPSPKVSLSPTSKWKDLYSSTTNVNETVPIEAGNLIVCAQAKVTHSKKLHVQMRTDQSEGYYSFQVSFKTPFTKAAIEMMTKVGKQQSYGGTDVYSYFPLSIEKGPDGSTIWAMANNEVWVGWLFDTSTKKVTGSVNTMEELKTGAKVSEPAPAPSITMSGHCALIDHEKCSGFTMIGHAPCSCVCHKNEEVTSGTKTTKAQAGPGSGDDEDYPPF
jgi:hypothetical protein